MSLTEEVRKIIKPLFANGNTPLKQAGIDVKLIEAVEAKYPHIAKQYPSVPV